MTLELRWTRRALAGLDRIAAGKPQAAVDFVAGARDSVARRQVWHVARNLPRGAGG